MGHLTDFNVVLHADGYSGYKKLYGNDVIKIKPSALADDALPRIGELHEIEARVKGMPPDARQRQRQEHARPQVEALHRWIKDTLPKIRQKQTLAGARPIS